MKKTNNNRNEQESLKKSHSIWSNSKLTVLCLFSSTVLQLGVVAAALIEKIDFMLYVGIGFGVLFILSLLLFSAFKR